MVAELMRRPGSGILGIISSIRPENEPGFEAWLDEGPGLGVVGYRRILHEVPDEVSRTADVPRQHPQDRRARAALRHGVPGAPAPHRAGARPRLPQHRPGARPLRRARHRRRRARPVARPRPGAGRAAERQRQDLRRAGLLRAGRRATSPPSGPTSSTSSTRFGPDRCLWGSDWPVVNTRASLPAWIAATRAILDALAPDEAAAIAHRTAERVYGVPAAADRSRRRRLRPQQPLGLQLGPERGRAPASRQHLEVRPHLLRRSARPGSPRRPPDGAAGTAAPRRSAARRARRQTASIRPTRSRIAGGAAS